MHYCTLGAKKVPGFFIVSVSLGRMVTRTEQFFDGSQSDLEKKAICQKNKLLFPDFFPHFHTKESVVEIK